MYRPLTLCKIGATAPASVCHAGRMVTELEAEAASLRAAVERTVYLSGCGDVEAARRLLSAFPPDVNAGPALLRAYERTTETAERCHRERLAPIVSAWERGAAPATVR
jgi:hypothetical protein